MKTLTPSVSLESQVSCLVGRRHQSQKDLKEPPIAMAAQETTGRPDAGLFVGTPTCESAELDGPPYVGKFEAQLSVDFLGLSYYQ